MSETTPSSTSSAKTYTGSCHCQRVRFSVELDLQAGTGKCNCTICTKTRAWNAIVQPAAFKLLAGQEDLCDYQGENKANHNHFCRHCGVRPFGQGYLEELGGAYYSIAISCLDDVTLQELSDAPVRYFDGRDNNWMNEPAVTSYL